MKLFPALILLLAPVFVAAQSLTPEQLRAQLDERSSSSSAFRAMLNDPDPARSRAAMELMVESKQPDLVRLAIDFGLLSASPDVRSYAFEAFLSTRPTLLVQITVPEDAPENFEAVFRTSTNGTLLANGTATYSMNIGDFDDEQNCYRETAKSWCGVAITPNGVTISTRNDGGSIFWTFSNLTFQENGKLEGASTISRVEGGFPTSMTLTP